MTEQFHSRLYLVQMSLYSNIDSISMMTFCALNFYAQPSVEVQHLVFLMEKKLIKEAEGSLQTDRCLGTVGAHLVKLPSHEIGSKVGR